MLGKTNKALLSAGLFLLVLLLTALPALAVAPSFSEDSETVMLRGRVVSVEDMEPEEDMRDFVEIEQLAVVEITSGEYKGETHTILNALMGHPFFDLYLTEGRRVTLWGEVDDTGTLRQVYLQDFVRDTYLYALGALFVLALVLVGRRKGLVTVVTLLVTVFAVARILLPLLLKGYSPVPITILIASGITVVTLVGIGGFQRKTAAAAIGTVGGVMVAGLLALMIGQAAHLTGFSSEEAQMLLYMETGLIDVRGLLFAGIIIGALGAVMDVSMSIAAASHEIYCVNPAICMREQIKSAMNVGRDVMGTMANTLILAYVGTTMPLLLLFLGYETPFMSIINMDLIATEVVRALSGSIGLVAAIPLTALASGLLTVRNDKNTGASVK
ncbi:MAG: YibE/F family protein [Bacillota bacterium]|nr:YibE/F family protein [Bacillota bacterium]MDW7684366.1 YibE/F family protein [Bacillota bacterium]